MAALPGRHDENGSGFCVQVGVKRLLWRHFATSTALVAQPDRAPDFESGGREFESLRARQYFKRLKLAGDFERLGAKVCLILGCSAPHVTGAVMLGYFGRR
jgi:hypothetical protein